MWQFRWMQDPIVMIHRQRQRRSAAARDSGNFGGSSSPLCYKRDMIGCGARYHVIRVCPGRRALLSTSLAPGSALIVKSAYKFARLSISPTIAIKLIYSSSFHYHTSFFTTNFNHHQLYSQWVTRRVRYRVRRQALDVIATVFSRHGLPTLIELAHLEQRPRHLAR